MRCASERASDFGVIEELYAELVECLRKFVGFLGIE